MKVLYVTGSCLTRNTSANMSHNAFVQGLLENGCEVDIIMAAESWGEPDSALPIWEKARYYPFPSVSLPDRLRHKLRGKPPETIQPPNALGGSETVKGRAGLKAAARAFAKKVYYQLFRPDPLYPMEKEWLKNAAEFRSNTHYDLMISNSSPAASHRLAGMLKNNGSIYTDRWIQIWEDPWSHDLYDSYPPEIEEEEHRLLKESSEIAYVSPLTLMYQKRLFPDCAEKMYSIPLPALRYEKDLPQTRLEEIVLGYFGDYYSSARDLRPFYEAVRAAGCRTYIYGDTDQGLEATDKIEISPRVTLERLKSVQEKATVLVHLSNLRGGQIPGKIYHYSVTNKPILFILDGTNEERDALRTYFSRYDRYYFCNNTAEKIEKAICQIAEEKKVFSPLRDFTPENVVKLILEGQ